MREKSYLEKTAYFLCTFGGIGYVQFAPGTLTSIVICILYYLFQPHFLILLAITLISLVTGIILGSKIESFDGKDPQHVVIDEVAGQTLAFIFVPSISLTTVILALILFRFFDIIKPLGINSLQKFSGGLGIMLDDILAGIYAGILLHFIYTTGLLT